MRYLSFLLVSALIISFSACKKNGHDATPNPPDPYTLPKGIATKKIQIVFPENINMDAASCSIYSLALLAGPEKDGTFKVPYSKGSFGIAWVFDKDKDPVLAGFITDTTNTISAASTADVLLYLRLGTTFQPHEVIEKYINGVGTLKDVGTWRTQVESLFKNDPKMLKKGAFENILKTEVDAVLKSGAIPRKPADITVDANDIRSGLQLAESGFNNFTITNNIRRRSYAFVYKMNYTGTDGKLTTVNQEISGSTTSLSNTKISPTGAIRDYKGVMQDWAAGKGMEFAATTSSPIEIPLEDNETMANFKVRVIGPGKPVSIPMTSYERERWWNVSLQTALFDYLLPGVLDIIGHKEILAKMNSKLDIGDNLKNIEAFVEKTGDLIAAIPAASDALESGDFKTMMTEVFFAITNSRLGNVADEWLKFLYNNVADFVEASASDYYKDPSVFEDRLENLTSVLQIIDMTMKGVDYARITKAILQSNTIEAWDLKAREVQVSLDPNSFSIGKNGTQKLTAHIKTSLGDDAPVLEYEWETAGKYGSLSDDRGHTGIAFSSSLPDVVYHVKDEDLGEGEHKETIKVNIYAKKGQQRNKIGSASSVAVISKEEVVVAPAMAYVSISPSRKDGYGNQLYNAGNPRWDASIKPRPGAKSYTTRVIINGVKGVPNKVIPKATDTTWRYIGGIIGYARGTDCTRGSLFAIMDMSESEMLKEKERQEAIVACWSGLGITGVEFTIEY